VVGSVTPALRRELEAKTSRVFSRRAADTEHLGPLRPTLRR